MTLADSVKDKISNANTNTYVIFYVDYCPYCKNAINLLKDKHLKFKGYNIDSIDGKLDKLLNAIKEAGYDLKGHRTKPLIFLNNQFIGGYDDLVKFIKN